MSAVEAGPSSAGITGYRELSVEDKESMNAIKSYENMVGTLAQELGRNPSIDQRLLNMAISELQIGFMLMVRSIAQPQSKLQPVQRS